MADQKRPTHVPWGDPTECPTCTGQARSREVEGTVEWDPVRLDPTDLEQTIRAAEAPVSLIRDSLRTLEALGDEGASDLAGDTRRLLMVWDRYKEIVTARVERAREAEDGKTSVSAQWRAEAEEAGAADDDFQRGRAAALRQAADELEIYGPTQQNQKNQPPQGEGES